MSRPIYLIAESGEPKRLLEAWRNDLIKAQLRLSDFMADIGANGFFKFGFEKPVSFRFPTGGAPEGWTKPSSRGSSVPKKTNREMIARIDALEWSRPLDALVAEAFNMPRAARYGTTTCYLHASGPLSNTACWPVVPDGKGGRCLGDVILGVPDFDAVIERADGPITWLPEGSEPAIPEGFRRISEAEVDLIFAQAKVALERAAQEGKEDICPPQDVVPN